MRLRVALAVLSLLIVGVNPAHSTRRSGPQINPVKEAVMGAPIVISGSGFQGGVIGTRVRTVRQARIIQNQIATGQRKPDSTVNNAAPQSPTTVRVLFLQDNRTVEIGRAEIVNGRFSVNAVIPAIAKEGPALIGVETNNPNNPNANLKILHPDLHFTLTVTARK